jgi:hypothetical protein
MERPTHVGRLVEPEIVTALQRFARKADKIGLNLRGRSVHEAVPTGNSTTSLTRSSLAIIPFFGGVGSVDVLELLTVFVFSYVALANCSSEVFESSDYVVCGSLRLLILDYV